MSEENKQSNCKICGQAFPYWGGKLYCSADCRKVAMKERAKVKGGQDKAWRRARTYNSLLPEKEEARKEAGGKRDELWARIQELRKAEEDGKS